MNPSSEEWHIKKMIFPHMIDDLKVGDKVPVPPEPRSEREIMANWQGNLDKPLVSIICHTYNHENYIKDALNGFLMQKTDFPFEILVHDDASTDGTREVIDRYKSDYPYIVRAIYQKENKYSKGFKPSKYTFPVARGRFYAMCEGDDYWLDENKISAQACFLENNSQYSVCGHDALIIEEGRLVSYSKLPASQKKDFSSDKLRKGVFVLPVASMFVSDFDWYPPEHSNVLNGDDFIFSRLGMMGSYKFFGEMVPSVYRRHAGGVWSLIDQKKKKAESINTYYWIMQYYERRLNKPLSSHFSIRCALEVFSETPNVTIKNWFFFNIGFFKLLIKDSFPGLVNRARRIFSF